MDYDWMRFSVYSVVGLNKLTNMNYGIKCRDNLVKF